MYFSAKQLFTELSLNPGAGYTSYINMVLGRNAVYNGASGRYDTLAPPTMQDVESALRLVKSTILNRDPVVIGTNAHVGKWIRPWDVIPELINFRAPEGDYGVGIEVEMAFATIQASRQVANHVRNWRYITLDYEGGANPIEATFPPIRYSKFNSRCQAVRYLDYLKAHEELCTGHNASHGMTGTHVNVSKGGATHYSGSRCQIINEWLGRLNGDQQIKYFGRRPYGYIFPQNTGTNQWLEFKLFKSTLDSKQLRMYVDVAVALTELVCSTDSITQASVIAALEKGYNKRKKVKPQAIAVPVAVPTPVNRAPTSGDFEVYESRLTATARAA